MTDGRRWNGKNGNSKKAWRKMLDNMGIFTCEY